MVHMSKFYGSRGNSQRNLLILRQILKFRKFSAVRSLVGGS